MSVLRLLLRPGWIALGIAVAAFAALCFSVLAPWQLGKNTTTSHRNDLIRVAAATPPAPLLDVVRDPGVFDPRTEWREVSVSGHYRPDKQVLLRLRSVDGQPAVQVLTPFETENGTFLVNRGYVRPAKAAAIPDVAPPPTGTVQITARIRASEGTSPGRGVGPADGAMAALSIDPVEAGRVLGVPLAPFYLQLSAGQPGSLTAIELPQLESGPYLSYGLQWLAFGIMAPLGVAYFLFTEIRQRRRQRAADAEAEAVVETAAPTTKDRLRDAGFTTGSTQRQQIGEAPSVTDDEVKRKLADRYGRG
ncbi:SURF1 family cytochrome oxidase biogenesis protein [Gordonia crocea]|uniref:SURF1-like protein n=1 Tax=Gordonia crocea TaxID=589162 RepID=A0A7I9V096_9ACTN|nr:SURF1 family cytochrome oxidase biogenesis protein [Gordonia crocea]GED98529.1 SURF1-like protein [Gordonia crocea]